MWGYYDSCFGRARCACVAGVRAEVYAGGDIHIRRSNSGSSRAQVQMINRHLHTDSPVTTRHSEKGRSVRAVFGTKSQTRDIFFLFFFPFFSEKEYARVRGNIFFSFHTDVPIGRNKRPDCRTLTCPRTHDGGTGVIITFISIIINTDICRGARTIFYC